MAIVILRPNATLTSVAWQGQGGTTFHGRLADDSDTTYGYYEHDGSSTYSSYLEVEFSDMPSIPAGARIKHIRLRTRGRSVGDQNAGDVAHRIRIGIASYNHNRGYGTIDNSWVDDASAWHPTRPGNSFEWEIEHLNNLKAAWRVKGANPGGGGFRQDIGEAFFDVEYNERPVAAITGPTGTIGDTSAPQATWSYTDPENDPQESFRVIVEEGNTLANGGPTPIMTLGGGDAYEGIYDSGRIYSSGTSHILPPMENGTYTIWVRVSQVWSSDFFSEWAGGVFTINITPPAVPTLTLTEQPTQGRIQAYVLDPLFPSAPVPTADFQIQYHDGNGIWADIRDGAVIPAVNGEATLWDYEAPPNIPRFYRARARSYDVGTGDAIISSWSTSQNKTLEVTRWWLKDPLVPANNTVVRRVGKWQTRKKDSQSTSFYGLGRREAVVVSGLVTKVEMSQRFLVTTQAEIAAIEAFLLANRDILLVSPRTQWYVRIIGQVSEEHDVGIEPGWFAHIDLTFAEVSRP